MQDFQGLTNNLYSILADRALPSIYQSGDPRIEESLLQLIEKQRTNGTDSLLLSALKCELLADLDPETARETARAILSSMVNRPDSEKNLRIKGICYYVVAVTTDKMSRFSAPGDDLYFLRKAVEAFPAHWNAAAVLADKLFNAGASFDEIKQILTLAVRLNDQISIRARYQQQIAYLAFRAGKDYDAIEYYEKAMVFRTLSQLHLSLLAAACGRTGQYEKAVLNFKLAQIKENDLSVEKLCAENSSCGISHPEIWRLAEDAVEDYRDHSSIDNTVRLALVFELLPVNYSNLVCDAIARQIDALNQNDQSVFDAHAELALKHINQWLFKRRQPCVVLAKSRGKCRCVAVPSGARRVDIAYL